MPLPFSDFFVVEFFRQQPQIAPNSKILQQGSSWQLVLIYFQPQKVVFLPLNMST